MEMSDDMYAAKGKPAWTENDNYMCKKTNLKCLIKPVLFCMALLGNFSFSDLYPVQPKSWKLFFSTTYRAGFFVFYLFLLGKGLAAYFYVETALFEFSSLILLWAVFLLTNYLIMLKSTSTRFGHFQKVAKFWEDKIMPGFEEMGIKYDVSKIKKRSCIVLTAAAINIMLSVAGNISLAVELPSILSIPFNSNTVTVAVIVTFYSIAITCWILPVAFIVIFSIVLIEAFNAFTSSTSKTFEKHDCKMEFDFRKYHLMFLNVCKLVNELDQDVQWLFGAGFFFHVGFSVFTLYQVIRVPMATTQMVVFLYWFAISVLHVGLGSIFAACLHESAHSPLDNIYYLNVEGITVEKLALLNMFLSKLTGTQIGFSVCGILILNKEFILTIAGVFLTYFAVLYTL